LRPGSDAAKSFGMPLVPSAYRAPRWLASGHVQTLLPVLLPRRSGAWRERERLELPDGDFLDLFWRCRGRGRLAVLCHGLEGSVQAGYMRGMASALEQANWDVLAWNFRGCGGVGNRLARSYHSGETDDLRQVIRRASSDYGCLALIGFSLGGNVVLKGTAEPGLPQSVAAAVAVSAPVDLASSAKALDQRPGNRLYQQRFLKTLRQKMREKAERFPDRVDRSKLSRIHSIRDFDEYYTAPLHGFRDAEDYWRRASAGPLLSELAVPSLLLNARNDPLLAEASFPTHLAQTHLRLHLEAPDRGGHVAFLDPYLRPWYESRVCAFLEAYTAVSNPGLSAHPGLPGAHVAL
jgi:predicted alpha/beta-fold hydrolase